MDGHEKLMTHRHDGQLQPDALRNVIRMRASGIDDGFAFDDAHVGFHARHAPTPKADLPRWGAG